VLAVSHRALPIASGDVDGEGLHDLLVVRGDRIDVHKAVSGEVGVDLEGSESGAPSVRVQALEACSGQGTWFHTQPEPGSR
jgi:hypothetical protein